MKKDGTREIRADLRVELCSRFCPYYKPGKKEDLACRGFLVIDGLIRDGRQIPFLFTEERPGCEIQESLLRNLCTSCAFSGDGCDFFRQGNSFSPCGGFIFLANLLAGDIVTIDNIRDVR